MILKQLVTSMKRTIHNFAQTICYKKYEEKSFLILGLSALMMLTSVTTSAKAGKKRW